MLLLVEDNPADILLAQEALSDCLDNLPLVIAQDGGEAMDILNDQEALKPDLILLDLNMPRVSGWEVLANVKQDQALRHIPVVVMTSSHVASDIQRAYDLQANAYVTKTLDFDDFLDTINTLTTFWFKTAELPSKTRIS